MTPGGFKKIAKRREVMLGLHAIDSSDTKQSFGC
jgi:hypothetical protein